MPSPRENPEALGGADAVPDTPDVAAHGAEPGGTANRSQPLARVSSGGSPPAILWIAGILAIILLVAVGFGIFI